MRRGEDEDGSKMLEEMDVHLMGDGVAAAGGSVAGERVLRVAESRLGERFGGTRK